MFKLSVFFSSVGPRIMTGTEIAVIGMACRVPGADNIDEFRWNLWNGVESISFFSDDELLEAGIAPELISHPDYVKAGGILENIERFDASFFGYSPREAALIDPQQRLFLEEAWNALEHAGYALENYEGAIGVYAGAGMNSYLLNNIAPQLDRNDTAASYQMMIGNNRDFLPTRVSYKLNLRGPSVNIQSACSTSLTAVHLACQGLLEGECDLALAGGVSVSVPQKSGYMFQEGMILSPDGHCRAFDAGAHGTVSGNGVGIVVLKRLQDALDDGDTISAIMKASAINNDGALKAGYTAPSPTGQARVITEALAVAEVDPDTIGYIEAHGTGTPVGDPIEIQALTQAFRAGTERKGFCAIGSVKSNVGHLDAAAGVVGLLKTVLALKHKQIPPSLHFERPNPEIDFADTPFYVNATLAEWRSADTPRRAGVSSFGIGGTNVHLIMEEFIAEEQEPTVEQSATGNEQLLLLSAKSESALKIVALNLAKCLRQHPEFDLADVAYTLQRGRQAFPYRKMLVCRDADEAIRALSAGLAQAQPLEVKEDIHSLSERTMERRTRLHELGTRWAAGEDIDFSELHAHERRRRIPLPTYPFERQRYWIEAPLSPRAAPSAPQRSSQTSSEQTLVAIWRQVLGIEQIGVQDDFFDLGGDSLLIAQIVSRIQRAFGIEIAPYVLFEKPTVAELTEHLETLIWAARGQEEAASAGIQEEGEI